MIPPYKVQALFIGDKMDYKKDLHPALVYWMARSKLTDEEIAKQLGISVRTLHRWKLKFPEFGMKLHEGKEFIDILVESRLLQNAMGFEYEEERVEKALVEGEMKEVRRVSTNKRVLPDTTAQRFWLINRQPGRWKDKVTFEHTVEVSFEGAREKLFAFLSGGAIEDRQDPEDGNGSSKEICLLPE